MSDEAKPAVQREAEALDETVTVAWQDFKIVLPATVEDWDPDILEAFEKGHAVAAIRGLLGSDRYEQLRADFRKQHGRKITVRDLTSLGEVIAETYGFESQGG